MEITKLKRYRITYTPKLTLSQEVVDPYNEWNCENVCGEFIYVRNYDKELTKVIEVEALTKETAKAMFSVRLYTSIMTLGVKGGVEPYIIDGIRNIVSIEEVSSDE